MIDIKTLKTRLKEYLNLKGIQITQKNGADRIHCPEPAHTDNEETAIYYEVTNSIHCPVCATTWDIFEVAGLLCNIQSFPDKIREVQKTLGIPIEPQKPDKKYKAITYKEAKKKFTLDRLMKICEFVGSKQSEKRGDDPIKTGVEAQRLAWGDKITGAWKYMNEDGLFELLDARFEGAGKKTVMSFYWTGNSVACSKYPILLYNRDKLHKFPDIPRLIHEGAKCAAIAEEKLPTFIHTCWNGGGAKVKYVDFSPLRNTAQIYIYPDDDHKKDNQGNDKPPQQQPGIKTAIEVQKRIKKQLKIEAKIIQPFPKAMEIKPDGADIVEALEVSTPEELAEYIISSSPMDPLELENSFSPPYGKNSDSGSIGLDEIPFKILGIAEDKYAYFIDYSNRIQNVKLTGLSKNFLKVLAPLNFWKNGFQHEFKMTTESWEESTDWLIQNTTYKNFNTDRILGRGAWKNKNGSLCYWDGEKLTGKADSDKIFEFKNKKDIGITDKPAKLELLKTIFEIVKQMNFETETDCIYFMAWCILSPFSGSLVYRVPLLLTGESESGKSSIFKELARPLTLSFELTGSESSPAGCRQKNRNNSEGIIIEEADAIGKKQKEIREGFFSLMRVSFCEDDPDGYKGTAGHLPISFRMKNMFLFISISPIIEEIADDKRLFIVNLKDKKNNWDNIKKQLDKLITEKNCRAIRALTWSILQKIIDLSKEIGNIIQKKIKLGSRRSRAEGLLLAAYYLTWHGAEKINMDEINTLIDKIYELKPAKEIRDQADEIINRILDEAVPTSSYHNKMTLREIIQCIATCREKTGVETDPDGEKMLSPKEVQTYKNIAGRYGLAVTGGELAIATNHHEIKKIIGMDTGYNRHLWRHAGCVEKYYNVFMAGKTRKCVIIAGVIEDIPF